MIRPLNHLFIFFILCIQHNAIHAQTLNADTLAKYDVSKVLTYTLDSTGQKVLKETRIINERGLISEYYSRLKYDSVVRSVHIDTFKYTYNSIGKLVSKWHSSKTTSYINGEEKIITGSWTSSTVYKNPLFVNPFSEKSVSYIYHKKECETIRRYEKGKCTGYFKYSDDRKYTLEKDYYAKNKRSFAKNNGPYGWKKYRIFPKKSIDEATCILNEKGDVIEKNISQKRYYYKPQFKKPVQYSYTKTYHYTYQAPFISACKTQQPYYVYTSKPKKEHTHSTDKYKRHVKKIRFVEERGTVIEEEFYEYIIDLPKK